MAGNKAIRVKIADAGAGGVPVATLLAQLQNVCGLLASVDQSIAKDGEPLLQWELKKATMQSPLVLELAPAPMPTRTAKQVATQATKVVRAVARIFNELKSTRGSVGQHDQAALRKAKKLIDFSRSKFLATEIDFGGYGKAEPVTIGSQDAAQMAAKASKMTNENYVCTGHIEGQITRVVFREKGLCVWLKERRKGQEVRCTFSDAKPKEILKLTLNALHKGKTIRFRGEKHYKNSYRKIDHMVVEKVIFSPLQKDLRTLADMYDPNYTDGLTPVEYVRKLRS